MRKIFFIYILLSFLTSTDIKNFIYDSMGLPISNVTISCGENTTTSNKDGYFYIKCNDENIVKFTHIKYKPVSTRNITYPIILNEKFIEINEYKIYSGFNETSDFTNISIIKKNVLEMSADDHVQNLLFQYPNLHYSGGTSRTKYFQIRGLGELSQFAGEGAPHFYVGYILDDINFSGIGVVGFLKDINQVEILRGPQSMSYGPNSMAGIINMVSNDPSNTFELNTDIGIYSYNGYKNNIVLSLPFNNNTSLRFTILNNYTNGMIENKFRKINDSNSKDEHLFRAKFMFKPNSLSEIKITYYLIDLNNKYDVWTPDNNGFTTYTDYQGYDSQYTRALSIKSKFQINNALITNIISYSNNNLIYSYDGDWGNNDFWSEEPYNWDSNYSGYEWNFPDYTKRRRESKTNEIRFKKNINKNLSSIIGFYASETIERDDRSGYIFAGFADNIKSEFILKNYAFYIHYNHTFNEKYKILYTLRIDINQTKQNLDFSLFDWNSYTNITANFNGYKNENDLLGGSIKSIYSINNNTNLTFLFSRGYKTSGINQSQSSYFENYEEKLRYYETEYSNNFELGLLFKNKHSNIKICSFYLYRINPQLRLFYQFDFENPNSFDYATINTKYGYNYGIEAEFEINPNNFILINVSASTLKTYISKFLFENNLYGDRENAHSPKFNLNFGINIDLSKYCSGLSINFNSNYKSSFYFDDQNNHKSKPYTISNFNISYKIKKISFIFWGNNIYNKRYPVRGYTFALDPTYEIKNWKSYGDLASFGITIKYTIK